MQYIRAHETLHAKAHAKIRLRTPVKNWTYDWSSKTYTQFNHREPIRQSLSQAAKQLQGKYTRTQQVTFGGTQRTVTVGVVVENGSVTWGRVQSQSNNSLVPFYDS